MFYRYEGLDVFYEQSGSGPAVLLLHGWGCTHEYYKPLASLLAPSYTVYNFDLPGFGASDEAPSDWGLGDYVKMLEAFIEEHCDGPVSLVGHSFGGRMAIRYASRHEVSRLALVDAAGIKPRRTLKYWLRVYLYKCKRFLVLKVFRRPDLFELWRAHQGSADYKAASANMKPVFVRVVNEDLKDCLPLIQAPTLLFWGENDTATPLADARLMQKRILDTRLVVIPGAGHYAAFVEGKEEFWRQMQDFFNVEG